MNTTERIEEFRKKLREGRPVRVRNGEVILEVNGEPKPAASPEPPGRGGTPEGVQVKPHDWGAGADAGAPFYQRPDGEDRALKEQALLAREYPGFEMDVDDDGTPYVHGWIGPGDKLRHAYHVLVLIPPAYGHGAMPEVHVIEPALRRGAPHMFDDGSLCLDHSGAFTRRSTLLTLLAWASVWLVLYEGWLETGNRW